MDERDVPVDSARLPSIDWLRGFAILWVVLFHLWGDLEFFPGAPRVYYEQLAEQVRAGAGPLAVFTAVTDLFFRDGFQGVPLFMMISGLSLTIAAYQGGDALRWPRFLYQRFRKLLVPYWAGVALTYAVIVAIAWRQSALSGDAFADRFGHGITISLHTIVLIDSGVVWASVTLAPRLLRDEWFFAPQLALWFVGLLAQYYLLFPLLFAAMKRIGVAAFLVATFAITVGANAWVVREYGALELKFFLVTGWAPFRLFEFTLGMALGWLLVAPEGRRMLKFVRRPQVVAVALLAGFGAHTAGDLLIGRWTAEDVVTRAPGLYWQALALPLVTLGLGLMALPLVTKRPSRADAAAPLRALATVGVMSYALLIVNDPMRLVASQLRLEDVPGGLWWTFVVAVYVPGSIAVAWPLAHLLGLMPKKRARAIPTLAPAPAAEPSAEPVPVLAGPRS